MNNEFMDSQYEEPTVLKRVKKRRRLCNEDNHTPKMTGSSSMSMFVQSALKHTPSESLERDESRQRGSTSNRKRRKPVSHELHGMLESVRFPGYEEEDYESKEGEGAAIEVFSESGSSEVNSCDGIEEEVEVQETVAQSKRSPFSDRKRRRERRDRRTIMPPAGVESIQQFDSWSSDSSEHLDTHTYPPSSPLPHLHTSTPTHSHHTHSMTIRDFCTVASAADQIATPTPEYKSIATPPSSPELATTVKPLSSGTSASVWMRGITLESGETSAVGAASDETMQCLNNTTLRGLGDSVESERRRRRVGRRRRGRVVPGGLAEAAERVAQHQNSEVAFWEHRARKIEDSEIDLSSCLTVEVCVMTSSHSLKVAQCRTLTQRLQQPISGSRGTVGVAGSGHRAAECDSRESGGGRGSGGDGDDDVTGKEGEEVSVLFSTRCARFLDLQPGQYVRIHPPWQCLTTPPSQHKVVLCTRFCQLLTSSHISHSTPHLPSTSLSTSPHRSAEGARQLSPTHKSPTLHTCTLLTKSQVQPGIAPTRLFPAADVATTPPLSRGHTNSHKTVGTTQCITEQYGSDMLPLEQYHKFSERPTCVSTPPPPPSNPSHDGGDSAVYTSLLSAMEGSCRAELSLKCRVLRVYRRTVFNTTHVNRSVSCLLLTKKTSESSQKSRWCVLVCDVTGMLCELQVSDFTSQTWSDVIRSGEGGVYVFRNLRVLCRASAARNPDLFSLIRHLCGHLSPLAALSGQSSSNGCGEIPASTGPVPIPSYCYVLVPSMGTVPTPSLEEDVLFPILAENTLSSVSPASDHDWGVTRCNICARVIHYQPEIPLTVQRSCDPSTHCWPTRSNPLTPHHGHYLFIVTPSHSTPSPDSPRHPSHFTDIPRLLRVYVKAQFPREDIENILGTCGERMMIRDVEVKRERDCTWYSVDSCSMVHPLTTADISQMVYPQYKFSCDEECVLRTIPPPVLPPLTSVSDVGTVATVSGIIVGIDEESAFSWPECNTCGNSKLSTIPSTTGNEDVLYCDDCQVRVEAPSTHLQLAVYIQLSPPSRHIACVQLLQSTIRRLLPVTPTSLDEGFEVRRVLEQSVCLDACYVHGFRESKRGTVLHVQEISIGQGSSSD